MVINSIHQTLEDHLKNKTYAKILDIGAWFMPYYRATHVVDLMPWETRGGKITLNRIPGESFTKETWTNMDLCDSNISFPFPTKFFDFVICSGTLEDLPDPMPCIREINRVGKSGYIRVPNTLVELTVGIENRENNMVGFFHHHWICQSEGQEQLTMVHKADAGVNSRFGKHLPLITFERFFLHNYDRSIHLFWHDKLTVTQITGTGAKEFMQTKLHSLQVPILDYPVDSLIRGTRRARSLLKGKNGFIAEKQIWWKEMLKISKPYSDPDLHRKAGG